METKRLFAVAMFLLCLTVQAQKRTITGTVNETESGGPLPGAAVIIKNTSIGTETDIDGNYQIEASDDDILVFSYLNYKTQEIKINNRSLINITLVLDNTLSEVVITSHNITREKKALGYDIDVIDGSDLAQKPEQDLTRALNGKSAGLQITQTSGIAGSGTNTIIRNYTSIGGSNQALFIVDGVPYSNDTNALGGAFQNNNGSSRGLDLDPNNVESVSVLKGLAATTLYGSEGRNGVILITTKTASRNSDDDYNSGEQAQCGAVVMRLKTNTGATKIGKRKLYVVDGQAINPYYNSIVENLSTIDIENKNTYESGEAKRLFGDLAKNGCVVITTPKGNYSIEDDRNYVALSEVPFMATKDEVYSTFSMNVSSTGYTTVKQMIEKGQNIPYDAVVIEEMINHFDFEYDTPNDDEAVAIQTEVATSPWNTKTKLVRVGLKAKELPQTDVPAYNYTVAKDAKIEVTFNPDLVKSYRLIGYGNNLLVNENYKGGKDTSEEINSGHTATALYEIVQEPSKINASGNLLTVNLEYKNPGERTKQQVSVVAPNIVKDASVDFKFAAAVAFFGMQLQKSKHVEGTTKNEVIALANEGKGNDNDGDRAAFIRLVTVYWYKPYVQ